jgi:signal transduction histidine kinase
MVLDYVATAASDLQPFAVEYRVRHASGHWRTVWEQSRPMRHGHQILLHGYIVDVTARVERDRARQAAEYERLQNQKTLALNKIAGCVLHEFNNIVHGVLSSADGLSMDLAPGHQAQESLKNIFAACNRAREFDQKVRALVQRPPLERKSISLAPVIEDCLDTLRSIVSDKVVIAAQLPAGCPAVHADAASLQQTLMDLCLYAWQGLPERRGHLEISLAYHPRGVPANVNSLRPGPHLCLTVRDHGPGLDKNALEKTFDPFHLRKATGRQTGLEMFLARETIQAHQGEIIVESQPDQGTAFHIYLPVAGES